MIPKSEKCTQLTEKVPNGHIPNVLKMFQMEYRKWPKNISTFSNLRPSKNYPKWDFWFENKPSGNPVHT
jgi:hypothetical protein